ncbi:hypothetical protein N2152v2_006605 [Parachlorella kessleri]
MGQCLSADSGAQNDIVAARNDYELVIRSSKELEHVLEACFGAQGKGLHEKVTSVQHLLPQDLVRKIRYLATIRNKLVHEFGFNSIPDRTTFINNFNVARSELQQVLAQHGKRPPAKSGDLCTIM